MASKSLNPQKNRLTKLIILAADYYNEIKVKLCDQYMNQCEPEFENKQTTTTILKSKTALIKS